MLMGLLLLSTLVHAQTHNQQQTVTKGYYSIGNNAQKLKSNKLPIHVVEATDTNALSIQKGYYSIKRTDSNRKKQFIIQVGNRTAPVVSKGYYSIGNNAKKLAQ